MTSQTKTQSLAWLKWALPGLALAAAFFLPVWTAQEARSSTEDSRMILGSDLIEPRRPPVVFDHDAHMDEFDCLDCHHLFVGGQNVLDPDDLETGAAESTCSACHNESPDHRMRAFHGQCVTCHEDHQAAPKACNSCHLP